MQDGTHSTPEALEEALELSEEILADIELQRVPLSNAALKASRLARLLNDHDYEQAMAYEAAGYPIVDGIIPDDAWRLAVMAGRSWKVKDEETAELNPVAYVDSISHLEEQLDVAKRGFDAARDPDVSVQSANPKQYVAAPSGNYMERQGLRRTANRASERLASRRHFIHQYVYRAHYSLKFSGVASEVFSRIRNKVDSSIGKYVPDAVRRLTAIYENLRSANSEDWSNAAHSCRRILKDLADAVFPPQQEPRIKKIDGKEKEIKLGPEEYVNRIVCFVEDNSASETAASIIGSDLRFLGDRLDAVLSGAQKGSHTDILTQEEADRIVVHTYMLLGDVLRLQEIADEASETQAKR